MDDPYWRYASAERVPTDNVPRTAFPGYLPSGNSTLPSHSLWSASDLGGASSDYLQKDILPFRSGGYGFDDIAGIGNRPTSGLGGLIPGASITGFSTSFEDPAVIGQRPDVARGTPPGISSILPERSNPLNKTNGLSTDGSNILFVDGLPTDCTRREVAHLFRPFIGFKEIRVVHREPRRSGEKALVLCFVEFRDANCATTALEALQGYKFDDKKPEAPDLRIQYAQFPFRPPGHSDPRYGSVR
ncbi:RNA-binding protein 2-like [Tasmannia lanceolata]|uniref:RNA-binding protein 2-like n=1 Tax=Tasmannia lanceolata TaxID=3420 RepID=UPI004063595A